MGVKPTAKWHILPELILVSVALNNKKCFFSLNPHPLVKFPISHSYAWVERGTVQVKSPRTQLGHRPGSKPRPTSDYFIQSNY